MVSIVGLRQAYSNIIAAYAKLNRKPVTTASDLRFIVPVNSNKTNYTFPIIVGEDTNNYPEGILLNRADAFTALEMGVFIGKKTTIADTQYDIYSYPNSSVVTVPADVAAFRSLFNHGTIDVTINNVQYLQNFSVSRMRKAPITQTGLTYGYTTAGATVPNGVDSFDGTTDGYYPVVPTLQLSGTSKINISLSLPQALIGLVAPAQYVIILSIRGFLSLGASNQNK